MKKYKPEILAPAGQIKSVYGAFNAGADAVYLGAALYSARAFAKNLSTEEICEALDYAHVHDKKIYLTMNTLLKNDEILDAVRLVEPLYERGLDGIIVQDLGLIKLLNQVYPKLPLHGSTQLAITSHQGVETLREMNLTRIVPARELTLSEIKEIKKTGMEVECFIHGAMCYCYSGKCLFSSIAGGRSGNRGRCAGPCRKEYDTFIDGKRVNSDQEKYPISMRDMCLVNNICDFIDAGIDSFKIEGRMKAPEYSAGVSAIYRQVIDEYLSTGKRPVGKGYEEELKKLYIRANTSTGYLYNENGRNMISLGSPSYQGISDADKERIKTKYIDEVKKLPVSFEVYAYEGSPLVVEGSVKFTFEDSEREWTSRVEGEVCQSAINRATDEATFKKQLGKLGDTFFCLKDINVYTDDNSFVMVSAINDIRRQIIDGLMKEICGYRLVDHDETERRLSEIFESSRSGECAETGGKYKEIDSSLYVGVKKKGQLEAIASLDSKGLEIIDGVIVDLFIDDLLENDSGVISTLLMLQEDCKKVFLRLPSVVRENKMRIIEDRLKSIVKHITFDGVYVGGLDAYGIALRYFAKECIIFDEGQYVFNNYSEQAISGLASGYTASYENSGKELYDFSRPDIRNMIIYGYIPLMYSANCLLKTFNRCNKNGHEVININDESGRSFNVVCNHDLCINTIYNLVPLDLFDKYSSMIRNNLAKIYRIEFTFEGEDLVREKILACLDAINGWGKNGKTENKSTSGHYKRGVD